MTMQKRSYSWKMLWWCFGNVMLENPRPHWAKLAKTCCWLCTLLEKRKRKNSAPRLKRIWVSASGGKRGPNPRFSPPRPQIFGDGAGMGTWYEKTLGIFWGWGWVENWGFLGFYPWKSPKIDWGNFGDGIASNLEIFWVLSPKILKKNLGVFQGRG